MKILTLGGATQDIFICCHPKDSKNITVMHDGEKYIIFREGEKINVSELKFLTGGGSTNSATSFKYLGFDVECFCKIGNDEAGINILKQLKEQNIDTKHIKISSQAHSGLSFIIGSNTGEQTVFAYRGINGLLEKEDLPSFQNYNLLYITSLSNKSGILLPTIVKKAKENNLKIAINPGASQLSEGIKYLIESLSYVDTFILNKHEAELFLTSIDKKISFSIEAFVKKISNMGPNIVVVTDGAHGVWVFTNNQLLFHPAMKIKVIGSVGAGDAFGSTFVGILTKTNNVETALRAGIINSASVISKIGAKNGLLTFQQIETGLETLDKNLLQKKLL